MLTNEQRTLINSLKAIGVKNENPQYLTVPEDVPADVSQEIIDANLIESVSSSAYDKLSETLKNEGDFTISTNDIEELDIFFRVRSSATSSQYRESFAHVTFHSAANSEPIFALGSPVMLDVVNGAKLYAGKLIINALTHHTPLNALCELYGCNDIYDLPGLDLIVMPKNVKEKYLTKYSGAIIKNIKFKDWFLDRGTENPGAFFVLTYVASHMVVANLSKQKSSYKNLRVKNMVDAFTYNFDIEYFDDYFADFKDYIDTAFSNKSEYLNLYELASKSKNEENTKKAFISACPHIYDIIFKYISMGA